MSEMSNEFKDIEKDKSNKNTDKIIVVFLYILVLVLIVMVVFGIQNKPSTTSSDINNVGKLNAK